ncbi:hypothetical protein BDW22DRAFT_1359683 [Trametopsis cervina]|nr:hypothetical protein BDW22DRAFT_1359683 [Trametopsis cervina]
MTLFNATAFILDDIDPRISYSAGWQHINPSHGEYQSTRSSANIAGLNASFSFIGTGVEVYGSVASIDFFGRPVSTYAVDGFGPNTTFQAPIIQPGYVSYNVLFYRSPPLPAGQSHTLRIVNMNGTSPSNYVLDYIVYTPSTNSGMPNAGLISASPSTQLSPTLSSTPISTDPTQTASEGDASHHHTPAAAIAGGVVGGIMLLAIIVLAAVFYRRWIRRKALKADKIPLFPPDVEEITPFDSGPHVSAGITSPHEHSSAKKVYNASDRSYMSQTAIDVSEVPNSTEPPTSASQPAHVGGAPSAVVVRIPHDTKRAHYYASNPTPSTSQPTSTGSTAATTLNKKPAGDDDLSQWESVSSIDHEHTEPPVHLHSDSGVRLPFTVLSSALDIPPVYTAD